MLVATKQRFLLWLPSLLFMALVLGKFDRRVDGDFVYQILENGFISSVFLLFAAAFIAAGDRKSFAAGIIMWVLALIALFALNRNVIVAVHL
jgi:hypothetical protein